MNSQQQTQEVVKISNSQFYTGNVRSVKQRAKQFNGIANNNLKNTNNTNGILNKNSAFVSSLNSINKNKSLVNGTTKNVTTTTTYSASFSNGKITNLNNTNNQNITSVSNNNNNISNSDNNIKISIVNKYTTNGNASISATATNGSKSDNDSLEHTDVKAKINHINTTCISQQPSKMSGLWNTSGWIRVYCGPDRSEFSCEDPSRMVNVSASSTTVEVVKDMDLPGDYTLWVSW